MQYNTFEDIWREYEDLCGRDGPPRTRFELRAKFNHLHPGERYEDVDVPAFMSMIFKTGWAWDGRE